jgi:hypothetical protein
VPDLGERLEWLCRANTMVILEDGFPARLSNGILVVHPLDGRYLLEALLETQAEIPRRRLRAAIARVAYAIVARAEPLGEALVLWYADTASSMAAGQRHTSGLLQAYYAAALTRAARLLGDEVLQTAADRFFAALLTPASEGGALYDNGDEISLAQVPMKPRDFILNGWLSMLVSVHSYAEMRGSGPARALFSANVATLRRVLPLYDVPALRLSRYSLIGPLLLRLGFSTAVDGVTVTDLRIALPEDGEIRLPLKAGGRWTARAYPEDADPVPTRRRHETLAPRARGLRCIAVLTLAGYPTPNRLRMRLDSPRSLILTTSAHIGHYDPDTSATVDRTWVELDSRSLTAGTHDLDIELPYPPIELFAYPTNFARGGPGERVNTYHGTHIVRLRQLAALSGVSEFSDWAERWAGYILEWPANPELVGATCWTPEGAI